MKCTERCLVAGLAALLLAGASGVVDRAAAEGASGGLPVGAQMADFGLRRLDFRTGGLGKMVWLSDYVGPAAKQPRKLLLLNFFATWCKPCLAELPQLVRWQRSYASQGLSVLSINYRNDGESWKQALSKSRGLFDAGGPPYPVLFDKFTNRNQQVYMGEKGSLPCNILLNSAGTVVARFQGGAATELAALEARIRKELNVDADAASTQPVNAQSGSSQVQP